jgi:hypothetical protein
MGKVVPLICIVALYVTAPAQAKGPDRATLTGPGLERPLVFGQAGMPSLSVLTQKGGFWAQAFGTSARADQGKLLAARPRGNLGPRYLVAYRVPSSPETSSVIWQVLYPYAAKPVSHMAKQPLWGRTVPGGWYQLGPGLKALLIEAGLPATPPAKQRQKACAVTRSTLPSRRYGSTSLWVTLPPAGILRVQRNQPDDGMFGTKLGWFPDRHRGLTLTVGGRRLDAPGRMIVRGVFWGRSSTGRGSWASPVAFPQAGCWRITGRAGATTLSYVVKVVPE